MWLEKIIFVSCTLSLTLFSYGQQIVYDWPTRNVIAVFFLLIAIAMAVSAGYNHLPRFPCELSHSGYHTPGYYFFTQALMLVSYHMWNLHYKYDVGITQKIGYFSSIMIFLTGVINDSDDRVIIVHSTVALLGFLGYLVYLFLTSKALPVIGFLAISSSYVSLLVCLLLNDKALHSLLKIWDNPDRSIVINEIRSLTPLWLQYFRAICQWVLILDLVRLISIRFEGVEKVRLLKG